MVVCRIILKFYTFFHKNVQEQQFFLLRSRVYHSLNTCKCLVFWWIWWQKLCHFLVYVHPIWKHLFVYVFFHYKAGSTFIFIHLNNEEEEVWPISSREIEGGEVPSQKEADWGSYEKARRSKHICHPQFTFTNPPIYTGGGVNSFADEGEGVF